MILVPVLSQWLTRLILVTNQGSLLQCDLLLVYSDLCLVRDRLAKRVLMVTDWSNLCAFNSVQLGSVDA